MHATITHFEFIVGIATLLFVKARCVMEFLYVFFVSDFHAQKICDFSITWCISVTSKMLRCRYFRSMTPIVYTSNIVVVPTIMGQLVTDSSNEFVRNAAKTKP